jgi:hypothetical protein
MFIHVEKRGYTHEMKNVLAPFAALAMIVYLIDETCVLSEDKA